MSGERDWVVLDVETKFLATDREVGGWGNFHKCGIGCAVVYEFNSRRFRVFGDAPSDAVALRARLERADRISGFNIRHFDLPVIYECPKKTPLPTDSKLDDLFERILIARGHSLDAGPSAFKGWGLDPVCKSTLGVGKIDSGKNAPEMWRSKRFADLHTYCLDDVALERDLAWFVEKNGFVLNGDQIIRLEPWTPAILPT